MVAASSRLRARRKAIDLQPDFALAYNNLGNALRAQGKLVEAVAAYHEAIALDPRLSPAHNGLGNALQDQNKLPEAIACFRTAILGGRRDSIVPSVARMGIWLPGAKSYCSKSKAATRPRRQSAWGVLRST